MAQKVHNYIIIKSLLKTVIKAGLCTSRLFRVWLIGLLQYDE